MSKHVIVPSHDERVVVDIEIPRPGRAKSLRFKTARLDFQPIEVALKVDELWTAHVEWVQADAAKRAGRDVEVPERPEIDGHTFRHPLEVWIRVLEMEDADGLCELTAGEREQIWKIWQDESEADLGESSASSDS